MIEISRLFLSYAKTAILEDVSLALEGNYSILGNNGSGKSSFAKALCGALEYNGSIKLFDKEVKGCPPKDLSKTIAYVPTDLEVYEEHGNVRDFLLFSRYAHKTFLFDFSNEDEKKIEKTLQKLSISHLLWHNLSTLSSGESALVLLASALVSEAKVLIFDEPTANLDPKNALLVASVIKSLQHTHQVLLITHDIELGYFMQNDVLFFHDKKIKRFTSETFFKDALLTKLYGTPFKGRRFYHD